jgi:hypothetical protein
LRSDSLSIVDRTITTSPSSNPLSGISADTYEITAEFDAAGATPSSFGLRLHTRSNGTLDRAVTYHRDGRTLYGQPLPPVNGRVKMRVLVDRGAGCASGDRPGTVQTKMNAWRSAAGITGGFMWLLDDIQKCSQQGTAADYASAINNAVTGPTREHFRTAIGWEAARVALEPKTEANRDTAPATPTSPSRVGSGGSTSGMFHFCACRRPAALGSSGMSSSPPRRPFIASDKASGMAGTHRQPDHVQRGRLVPSAGA